MLKAKVMLLGDMGVGKTSIMYRLVFDRFEGDYRTTLGVEILTHDVPLHVDGGKGVRLIFWDTDGDFGTQIFDTVYALGSMAAIIVSDATRPQTITRMVELATAFEERFPGRPFEALVNKADLLDPDRKMTGIADLPHVRLVSAKTGAGIVGAIADLAGRLDGISC
jgi:GTPase SAR1 family protein